MKFLGNGVTIAECFIVGRKYRLGLFIDAVALTKRKGIVDEKEVGKTNFLCERKSEGRSVNYSHCDNSEKFCL